MHGLPITAPVSEVLSLFQQCLHQGTANTGVAVSVYSVGEPRAGNADRVIRVVHGADHPSQAHHLCGQVSPQFITLITFAAPLLMDRDYINWLETLPCNRKPQKVNVWMGGWGAPLPEEVDLPAYEDWQDREMQRNPSGLMARLWGWIKS